jgi:membrane protein implicated in regulation of membrane protease activity
MIFFLIGLGGFFWALFTNIAGGDHDGDAGGDHDFSGDHDIGRNVDGDHDAGHDGDARNGAAHGPSFVSVRTFSIFAMFFGFGGALAQYYSMTWMPASLIGLGSGFIAALVGFQFFKLLYGQQASSTINIAELVGQTAEVINAIPAAGVGEVTIIYRGQRKDLLARSQEGSIPAGSKVKIVEDLGSSVLVVKAE